MSYNRMEDLENMREIFTDEELLFGIVKCMSSDDAKETFDYIRRVFGYYLNEKGEIVAIGEDTDAV